MASFREESNASNGIGIMMSELRDIINLLPAVPENDDFFSWDELIYSPEVLDKVLRRVSVVEYFEAIDSLGIGFNAMFPVE